MNDIQKEISDRVGGEWIQYGTSDKICCILVVENTAAVTISVWYLVSIDTNGVINLIDSYTEPSDYPKTVSISNIINESRLKQLIKIHKGKLANFK